MSEYRRLTLAIDCDDVIVPTSLAILDAYNQQYGTAVGYELYYKESSWGASSAEEASKRVDGLLRKGITAKIAPNEDAIEYIRRLHEEGHELHVVTGRQSYQEAETAEMLDRYFNGVFTSIEHTNMYAYGGTAHLRRSKGAVCAAIGADVLIDDHVHHGREVLKHGLDEVIVFGDYPWNAAERLEQGMARCANWASTYLEVRRIASANT